MHTAMDFIIYVNPDGTQTGEPKCPILDPDDD